MITLLQLEYFRRLAATEHITQTARELFISQTALSSMIIGLEKELGIQLFDRYRRAIHLNEAGKVYLEYVNSALQALENGKNALSDISGNQDYSLSIALGSPQVWATLIKAFHQKYPRLSLRQSSMSSDDLNRALPDQTVEFIIAGEGDICDSGLEKLLLKTDSVYLCVPDGHPMADRTSVSIQELKDEAFITLSNEYPWRIFCDRLFAQAGFPAHTAVECDYTLRGSLIEAGFGVALTSSSAMESNLLKPNRYIRIEEAYAKRPMYLFWNPRRYFTKAASSFRDFCIEYYRDAFK